MPGFMSGGFGGSNMMTPQERRAAMAKEAAAKRAELQRRQHLNKQYGTYHPQKIAMIQYQQMLQQEAMKKQQQHNHQMQQQTGNQMQQNQQQSAMQEQINRMGQTLQGRQELQRRGIRY